MAVLKCPSSTSTNAKMTKVNENFLLKENLFHSHTHSHTEKQHYLKKIKFLRNSILPSISDYTKLW